MANRYWVGGTATWDNTAGTKWATTSGGGGGAAVPTAADDVYFDAASSGICTIGNIAAVCRSLDCTGFTGTLGAVNGNLNVGDASGGAVTMVAGMTSAFSGTFDFFLVSTSDNGGTGWPITAAGKLTGMRTLGFNGAGGKWTLQDALTNSNKQITVTQGTLNANAQTITCGGFGVTSNSLTRAVDLTNATVTLSGLLNSGWSAGDTKTNLTMTLTGSTINVNGGGANGISFVDRTGSLAYNTVNVNQGGSGNSTSFISSGPTYVNLSLTSSVAGVSHGQFGCTGATVTGTLTLSGNSAVNRMIMTPVNASGVALALGTPITFTCNGTATATNVDFQDITIAGAAAPLTGTSLGDCGGNTGITFTSPVTRYAVTAGNWSSTGMWSTSSGGASGASVPLPQDTAMFDASSGAGTYTIDMPRACKDLTCTGFTRTLAHTSTAVSFYGNITFGSGMTFTNTQQTNLAGRGTHTILSAGKSFGNIILVQAVSGSYTMQDALTASSGNTFAGTNSGTFSTGGFTLSIPTFLPNNTTWTLDCGASTVNLTSTASGNIWAATSLMTLTASSATFVILNASTSARTFAGAGKTYGTLTYTVDNSAGGLTITGANTFTTLNVGKNRVLTMPAGSTNTVTNFNAANSTHTGFYIPGTTGNYASTPDSPALDITGDIDIRVKATFANWAPSTNILFLGKWNTGTSQQSYQLYSSNGGSAGRLTFAINSNGVNNSPGSVSVLSTAATGFAANTTNWIRVTWNATTKDTKFYTSSDGSSWNQLGTTVTLNSSIFSGSARLTIGTQDEGNGFAATLGYFHRVQIRNNILDDGSGIVFDADFTTNPSGTGYTFTESSSNAATVTINGTTSQPVFGRTSIVSSSGGSAATLSKSGGVVNANYLTIQDSTATGGAGWYAGQNSVNVSGNSGWIFNTATTKSGFFDFLPQ